MNILVRIRYVIEKSQNKGVQIYSRNEWERSIFEDGEITKLSEIPEPLKGIVQKKVEVILVIGSGYSNPDPGIDLIRRHEKDFPSIYTVDHYTVIQTPWAHPAFGEILKKAGVEESEELNKYLKDYVFLVGPEKREKEHHLSEIPDHIKNAQFKIKWFK